MNVHLSLPEHRISPRRIVPRLRVALPFRFDHGAEAEVIDLSAMGLGLRTGDHFEEGTLVRGFIDLVERELEVEGEVVWVRPPRPEHGIPGEVGIVVRNPSPAWLALVAESFAELD